MPSLTLVAPAPPWTVGLPEPYTLSVTYSGFAPCRQPYSYAFSPTVYAQYQNGWIQSLQASGSCFCGPWGTSCSAQVNWVPQYAGSVELWAEYDGLRSNVVSGQAVQPPWYTPPSAQALAGAVVVLGILGTLAAFTVASYLLK